MSALYFVCLYLITLNKNKRLLRLFVGMMGWPSHFCAYIRQA